MWNGASGTKRLRYWFISFTVVALCKPEDKGFLSRNCAWSTCNLYVFDQDRQGHAEERAPSTRWFQGSMRQSWPKFRWRSWAVRRLACDQFEGWKPGSLIPETTDKRSPRWAWNVPVQGVVYQKYTPITISLRFCTEDIHSVWFTFFSSRNVTI